MNDYISAKIGFKPYSEDAADLMAAFLADIGFESFQQTETGIEAFSPLKDYDPKAVQNIVECFPMDVEIYYEAESIEGKDWNEEWEKNYFTPIVVDDRCVVHSSFHTDVPSCEYDILIDPKMAFGTGHHATTFMMISFLLESVVENKDILDMGAGSGILSILARKLGARSVTGIEIDEMAFENTKENGLLNAVDVMFINGDASALMNLAPTIDIFLANINRNVILQDLDAYVKVLKRGGYFLFSGFYVDDIAIIEKALSQYGLKIDQVKEKDRWAAVKTTPYEG